MSDLTSLSKLQSITADMAAVVDDVATRLGSQAAQRHAVRAAGMVEAAMRELGAALVHEHLHAAVAASVDAPLTVEVIGRGDGATAAAGQPR